MQIIVAIKMHRYGRPQKTVPIAAAIHLAPLRLRALSTNKKSDVVEAKQALVINEL